MNKKIVMTIAGAFACIAPYVSADNITVATYGGAWGSTMQECILSPFEKTTGHTVTPEPGVAAVTLAKLRQQTESPSIDVAWIDGGVSELAAESGVLSSLKLEEIPGLENVISEGKYQTDEGDTYAVSTGFYALGIVYDTQNIKTPPTSWDELWNPEYSELVTIPSPGNAMGIPFLIAIDGLEGGDDLSKGFDKIKNLDVFSYFDSAGSATNSFQSGETLIGAHYATSAWSLDDKGLPIKYIVPEEGALGGDIRLHLVKNTPKEEIAKAFIDFAIQPAQASCMSEGLYIGPATEGVELSEKAQERMPWGKEGSIDNLIITDWELVNAVRSEVNEQWNKKIAR